MRFTLTEHAKERIRQRVGITSIETAVAWVDENITKAKRNFKDGKKTHYVTDLYEIICDGVRVVTVKPTEIEHNYAEKLSGLLSKEVSKMLAMHRKDLRKAEIKVAELTLNFLKAKNPNTKAIIQTRLVEATDEKQAVLDEIKAIELAASKFGITGVGV